jgi:hypothetical protein
MSQAWLVYRAFHIPESLVTYSKAASDCKNAIYSLAVNYEKNLVSNGNTGAFYRYANKKVYTKSSISPLLRSDCSYTGDPTEKAELMQEAFAKNYTLDKGVLHQWDCSNMSKTQQTYVYFSSIMVRGVIKSCGSETKVARMIFDHPSSSVVIGNCATLCRNIFFLALNKVYTPCRFVRIHQTNLQKGQNS